MYASIQKWGNSNAVRLPKAVLEAVRLRENDKIEIITQENQIILLPAKRQRLTLEEIFKDWDGEYICAEVDTGFPVGTELF